MSDEVSAPAPSVPSESVAAPVAEVSTPEVVAATEKPVVAAPEVKVDPKLASRFAAISKKEKMLEAKEKELAEIKAKVDTYESRKAVAKEDPLKFLQEEHGITFEQLTDAFVNKQAPEAEDPIQAKIKALEEKIAKQEAEAAAKQEEILKQENTNKRNAYKATVETDMTEFPLTSAYIDAEVIIDEVVSHYNKTGIVRPHKEVLAELESFYESKLEAISKIDKVKSRFGSPSKPVTEGVKDSPVASKIPVTLSNQAGGSPIPIKSVDDMSPSELREYQINKLKALRATSK